MKNKFKLITIIAVFSTSAFASSQAGTWAGFQRFDGGAIRNAVVAPNPNANTGARANRQGADDPANHDVIDNRGMNQPGEDNGRHRGRHRGRGR